jgi:hypothetical protein
VNGLNCSCPVEVAKQVPSGPESSDVRTGVNYGLAPRELYSQHGKPSEQSTRTGRGHPFRTECNPAPDCVAATSSGIRRIVQAALRHQLRRTPDYRYCRYWERLHFQVCHGNLNCMPVDKDQRSEYPRFRNRCGRWNCWRNRRLNGCFNGSLRTGRGSSATRPRKDIHLAPQRVSILSTVCRSVRRHLVFSA